VHWLNLFAKFSVTERTAGLTLVMMSGAFGQSACLIKRAAHLRKPNPNANLTLYAVATFGEFGEQRSNYYQSFK